MISDQLEQLEKTLEIIASTHRNDLIIDTARKILALDHTHKLAHFHLIFALYHSAKYEDLIVSIREAAKFYPNDPWVHYAFYLYYLFIGGKEYLKAKEHIEKAISLDPMNAHYYRSLGEIYLINREPDKAASMLEKAVKLNPKDSEYRSRYALALLRQHKVRESLVMANQALKDGTDEARNFDTVGMIYTLAGELDKGEELFREALRMVPTYDYYQKHIDWVKREKNDRDLRHQQGKSYTPLYLRQRDTKRFF